MAREDTWSSDGLLLLFLVWERLELVCRLRWLEEGKFDERAMDGERLETEGQGPASPARHRQGERHLPQIGELESA